MQHSDSPVPVTGTVTVPEQSELEIRLRQLGWTVTMTPLMEVAVRWPGCLYTHEWRVAKGPLEIRATDAAEVTRLVTEVETRARAAGPPVIERVEGPIPPRCAVLRRPAKDPPVPAAPRRRRKKVTLELVRCSFLHERHGTYCGALVWANDAEKLKHAVDAHGMTEPRAVRALFQPPKKRLGSIK